MASIQARPLSIKQSTAATLRRHSSQSSGGELAYSPLSNIPDIHRLQVSSTKKDRPCDACRKRKTRCAFTQSAQICNFCRSHSKQCTFLEKPAPRRRKANPDLRRHSSSDQSSSSATSNNEYLHQQKSSGIIVVPSVETDDSDPARGEEDGLYSITDILSPETFASVLDIYFATVWMTCPIVAREDVIGSLHAASGNAAQTLLAAICIVTCSTVVMSPEKVSTHALTALLQFVETRLANPRRSKDSKLIKASLLLLNCCDINIQNTARRLLDAQLDEVSYEHDANGASNRLVVSALQSYKVWSAALTSASRPSKIATDLQTPTLVKIEDEAFIPGLYDQYTALTAILRQLFALQSASQTPLSGIRPPTRQILLQAKPIQISLKKWYTALPSDINVEHPDDIVAYAAASINLAYYTAEILLHMHIINVLQDDNDVNLKEICRSAARTRLISAMDFLNRLRFRHLQGFWFCLASDCFEVIARYAKLLLETSTSAEETMFYEERRVELRWTLEANAKCVPFMDKALQVLDGE